MNIVEVAEVVLRGGLIQQVLFLVAAALGVAALSLYVVLTVLRRERR